MNVWQSMDVTLGGILFFGFVLTVFVIIAGSVANARLFHIRKAAEETNRLLKGMAEADAANAQRLTPSAERLMEKPHSREATAATKGERTQTTAETKEGTTPVYRLD